MKKTYINPKMKVDEFNYLKLLAGSDPKLGGKYNGGDILAPGQTLDDDFDFDD